jgi:hypothetical protein
VRTSINPESQNQKAAWLGPHRVPPLPPSPSILWQYRVPFTVVVEPQEEEAYREWLPEGNVKVIGANNQVRELLTGPSHLEEG